MQCFTVIYLSYSDDWWPLSMMKSLALWKMYEFEQTKTDMSTKMKICSEKQKSKWIAKPCLKKWKLTHIHMVNVQMSNEQLGEKGKYRCCGNNDCPSVMWNAISGNIHVGQRLMVIAHDNMKHIV